MAKKLDLSKSVYENVKQYPELVDILQNLGFTEITKPGMLNSVGRIMTIPKGAKSKNISMMKVVTTLMQNGYELTGKMPNINIFSKNKEEEKPQGDSTTEQLKGYLKRLGDGEDLESVRKDFVENFSEVEASDVMRAEQELIKEGTPITEVQKLCDVHSALFHGSTREEKIANAEVAVQQSLKKEEDEKQTVAQKLMNLPGHPLYTWTKENEKLSSLIKEIQSDLDQGLDVVDKLQRLRQVSIHYAKKGDLIYPVLKVRYSITGPSDVMWSVDDEIRDTLSTLSKADNHDEKWVERLREVLTRADEMIYKENNILFPICAVNFTTEEWYGIYQDAKDYSPVLDIESMWYDAEMYIVNHQKSLDNAVTNGEVILGGGHMTVAQLDAMLNTLPIEISFVDDNNINRYFNEGPKVFKRPQMAIDREVFTCHPPKIEPIVRTILDDFRNNKRDSVPVWMEKNGKPFLVTYMAVRDKAGNYLGTVEVVQDMTVAKEHFTD